MVLPYRLQVRHEATQSLQDKISRYVKINDHAKTLLNYIGLLNKFSRISRFTIHPGEIESLAILIRESSLTFCACDAAAIRTLPLLDLAERGISVE